MQIKLAVIIAMGKPFIALGMLEYNPMRSLSPLIIIISSEKPRPANTAYKTAKRGFIVAVPIIELMSPITSSHTPSTAQLVVISGRYMPIAL